MQNNENDSAKSKENLQNEEILKHLYEGQKKTNEMLKEVLESKKKSITAFKLFLVITISGLIFCAVGAPIIWHSARLFIGIGN